MSDGAHPLGATEVSPAPISRAHRSSLLKREMPGLDALRGLAVLAVVALHGVKLSQPPALAVTHGVDILVKLVTAGWLGVTLFFVLSGFLITGILLDTKTRSNYWRSFYVRRLLRILPVYIVTLLLLRFVFHFSWAYVGLCMLFVANLIEQRMQSYGVLWSLAVEEQFYLVWPFLVRRLRPRTLAALCLISIVASPWLRLLAGHYPLGDPYDATWLITDALSLGALVALFLRSRYSTVANVRAFTLTLAGLTLFVGGICAKLHILNRDSPAGRAFETEPFIFFFGLLLMLSLQFGDQPLLFRLARPLRFFGYISYGLYLYHWLFFVAYGKFFDSGVPPLPLLTAPRLLGRFVVSFALVTLIAYLSRTYFEEFFLRLKDKLVPYTGAPKASVK